MRLHRDGPSSRGPARLSGRVYLLFMGCAVLPLFVWCVIGWQRGATMLEERAYDHLRAELHAFGNGVIDRLNAIESDLSLAANLLAANPSPDRNLAADLPRRIVDRLRSLTLRGNGTSTVVLGEPPEALPDFGDPTPNMRCATTGDGRSGSDTRLSGFIPLNVIS